MTSDLDIWRSAQIVIDRHGADAPTEARRRADRWDMQAAPEAAATWRLIATACEELLATEPADGVRH